MRKTTIQGFPRIGRNRELKKALELYWKGEATQEQLENTARQVRQYAYDAYQKNGLDFCPVGDFSYYDKMLDMACMFGVIPARFNELRGPDRYFAMARGGRRHGQNVNPLAMKKWFNTNYHYLVPEVENLDFQLDDSGLQALLAEATAAKINNPVPVIIGPATFAVLAKIAGDFSRTDLINALLPLYRELLGRLNAYDQVRVDEPILVQNPLPIDSQTVREVYNNLSRNAKNIIIQTYFSELGDNWSWIKDLPVKGFGLDFVHGPQNLQQSKNTGFPAGKLLIAGVVDGRNVWTLDADLAQQTISELEKIMPEENLIIGTSCSLLHVPYTTVGEDDLPLSFAEEKLAELAVLKGDSQSAIDRLKERRQAFVNDPRRHNAQVQSAVKTAGSEPRGRRSPFDIRIRQQQAALNLPLLPTTTIGSFPQTAEVRRQRRLWRDGDISQARYDAFIRESIDAVIRLQEELDLDVLVHGEFERNDMVEYFGEQLDGFIFTRNGWVQSYGSRCVKPPIVYGDISRPAPMTVDTISYAQSRTDRPVKGMLTGPVTILNWSFVRDDLPRQTVCRQIALAIREEVLDLEKAGIKIIQVDEAAFREGLPLRQELKAEYLAWAVECFHLTVDGVRDATQIHTHMCYSEFNEIMDSIIAMDADVITIENSRAGLKLLEVFSRQKYPNQIGPGVYDIHSPLVPTQAEIEQRIATIQEVLDPAQVWINPDCGLKTRSPEEANPSLANMTAATRTARQKQENGRA